MILVADSGSSKSDWRLIDQQQIKQFSCRGLNPDFNTTEEIFSEVNPLFSNDEKLNVKDHFFYGSGCSSFTRNKIVEDGLLPIFPNATIRIEHDLLGAARAACAKNAGLAGILGTGSNCCAFDGKQVTKEFRSGGFIIGDEGGGVDLGKRLVKGFIEGKMPSDLKDKFDFRYALSVDEILRKLYKEPQPNRFLASFSSFVFQHREHPYISDLIQNSFRAYFNEQVLRFEESASQPLSLVGSIAFYYHEFIRQVAKEVNVEIGQILEKPISGLALYHQELLD